MKRLSVAVIGLGLGYHHVAAYAAAEAINRIVVCDLDRKRIDKIQVAFPNLAKGYTDLEIMLQEEHLDAVSIVTPDHLHRHHAEQCFAAGCHVLLTKPLATNLSDGQAIVRTAEAASRILMVAHERRFRKRIQAIRTILKTGKLGEIIHLRIDAIQDKRRQFRQSPWYASAEAGRTALVGSGIHEVDLLRYLIEKPIESVVAYSNHLGTLDFPKEKTTAALFKFAGGAIGQVTVTYEAHWPKVGRVGRINDHFQLVGTKGMIVGNRVALDDQDSWEELPYDQQAIVTGTRGCVTAFLRTIVEGTPVAVSGREAFASLAACIAADEAAMTGQPSVPASTHFN